MLDAIDSLPKDTEDAAVEKTGRDAVAASMACFAPWGAGSPMNWESQRVMAASMMMAPLAMANANAQAMRRLRALATQWGEQAARSKSMDELIDVNRRYGERAIALGAGEMWRILERSALLGRRATAPESFKLRDQDA